MKTLEELKNEVMTEAQNRPPYIRLGQFVFNYIDTVYGVARQVQFDDKVDCYHLDKNIDEFLECSLKRINELPEHTTKLRDMTEFEKLKIAYEVMRDLEQREDLRRGDLNPIKVVRNILANDIAMIATFSNDMEE